MQEMRRAGNRSVCLCQLAAAAFRVAATSRLRGLVSLMDSDEPESFPGPTGLVRALTPRPPSPRLNRVVTGDALLFTAVVSASSCFLLQPSAPGADVGKLKALPLDSASLV